MSDGMVPIEDAPEETVVREFANFLRAGGSFTWDDWYAMSERLRGCAVEAGTIVRDEVSLSRAASLLGEVSEEMQAAHVESVLDRFARRAT